VYAREAMGGEGVESVWAGLGPGLVRCPFGKVLSPFGKVLSVALQTPMRFLYASLVHFRASAILDIVPSSACL
jgi:hypothetical protein